MAGEQDAQNVTITTDNLRILVLLHIAYDIRNQAEYF